MPNDRIEGKWLAAFVRTFQLSKVNPGDEVPIVSETQSRSLNVQLAELALLSIGAKPFHVVVPTQPQKMSIPIRSTGASDALDGLTALAATLKACPIFIDLTVEGLLHAPQLPDLLAGGTRMLYVSDEHPEALERLCSDERLKDKVQAGVTMMRGARTMRVSSEAGTDLTIDLKDARMGGGWGFADTPGKADHWPGGLVACYPQAGAVNGRIVFAPGDINLTFKRYFERPVTFRIEQDYAVAVEGEGVDGELMRSYLAAWKDRNAYASSHVGWGMNSAARWEALAMYDKADTNGTEQRAFAGNFLFSTGANKHAGRFTLCHFDLPLRNCTITLDNRVVVERGELIPALR